MVTENIIGYFSLPVSFIADFCDISGVTMNQVIEHLVPESTLDTLGYLEVKILSPIDWNQAIFDSFYREPISYGSVASVEDALIWDPNLILPGSTHAEALNYANSHLKMLILGFTRCGRERLLSRDDNGQSWTLDLVAKSTLLLSDMFLASSSLVLSSAALRSYSEIPGWETTQIEVPSESILREVRPNIREVTVPNWRAIMANNQSDSSGGEDAETDSPASSISINLVTVYRGRVPWEMLDPAYSKIPGFQLLRTHKILYSDLGAGLED